MKNNVDNHTLIFHLIKPFIGLGLLLSLGTSGYMAIEHWNFLDSLFMSVITMTTVGYSQVHPLTRAGEVFTIVYILFGVMMFLYIASQLAEYVILVNFKKIMDTRKMENKLKTIKDHYIICGYGRTGAEIATQLLNKKLHFVIIDKNLNFEEMDLDSKILYITGDATEDAILEKAGIKNAKGLFCTLSDDVDNLYLTLSAKGLNPDLKIITRCIKSSNESKFFKAGAHNTILPYEISGRRMVASVIKPLVVDFLDVVMHAKGTDFELQLEQYEMTPTCCLCNQTIESSHIRHKTGVIIVAIKRGDEYLTNPAAHTLLMPGDNVIVLGTTEQLAKFEKFV